MYSPDSLDGYQTMWHTLCLRHKINVPWRLVESSMREVDPRGVEQRKSHYLTCRMCVSQGPNFCWHIDRYDKLKPFGFSIHGCVDGFSRRIIWLDVQRSNKNPKCPAKYLLNHVKAACGCPVHIYIQILAQKKVLLLECKVIWGQMDWMNTHGQNLTRM